MSLSRRDFITRSSLAAAGLLASRLPGETSSVPPRPRNVVLFLTDDQSRSQMSFTGDRFALTPNLDRLARNGVFFDTACCTHPVCTPSRASLHTGIYPWASGIHLNLSQQDEHDPTKGIPAERPLLATPFHEAGYACTHNGKWHASTPMRHAAYAWNPFNQEQYPADGYDHYPYRSKISDALKARVLPNLPRGDAEFGGWPVYLRKDIAEVSKQWRVWAESEGLPENFVRLSLIGRTGLPVEVDRVTTTVDDTLRDLRKYQDRPFFITCSVDTPHEPWLIQDEYYRQFDAVAHVLPANFSSLPDFPADRPPVSVRLARMLGPDGVKEFMRVQAAKVRMLDDQVGRVIRQLELNGQLDDTLIVFTSDHGEMNGGHGCVGKSVHHLYDELVRVPLIFHWPKGISGGRRIAQPVSLVDVMPTMLDLAGLPTPASCQGVSRRGLLQGAAEDASAFALCERTNPTGGMVQRLIRTEHHALTLTTTVGAKGNPRYELYDLRNDPGETRNLVRDPQHVALRDELITRLRAGLRATNDPWESRVSWRPV